MLKIITTLILGFGITISLTATAKRVIITCPPYTHIAKACVYKTSSNGSKYLQCSGTYKGNKFLGFKKPTKPLSMVSIVCNGIYCGEMSCSYNKPGVDVDIILRRNKGGKYCHLATNKFKAGYDGYIKNCQNNKKCYFICD